MVELRSICIAVNPDTARVPYTYYDGERWKSISKMPDLHKVAELEGIGGVVYRLQEQGTLNSAKVGGLRVGESSKDKYGDTYIRVKPFARDDPLRTMITEYFIKNKGVTAVNFQD